MQNEVIKRYSINEYLEILQAIPEEKWTDEGIWSLDGRCCAVGHLRENVKGFSYSDLEYNLIKRSRNFLKTKTSESEEDASLNIMNVNDGNISLYKQSTPKQRVLAFLEDMIKSDY